MTDEIKHQKDGSRAYYKDNMLHRMDGPAVEKPDGSQRWYVNGLIHRDDGPAVINKGSATKWYRRNKLHREDGPAIIFPDGSVAWYFNGHKVNVKNLEEYQEAIKLYIIAEIQNQ